MHDVARLAGVSVKTVSNVLNGYPYIRDATRAKVLAAIDELGYKVNISARNLRIGRTGVIALAVPELSLPYFAQLADAVIHAAEKHSLTVLVEQTGAERDRELTVLSRTRKHLVDGLIFAPLALGLDEAEFPAVDFPMVLLGERIFRGPFDQVAMSNVEAARAATSHLISLGRRRVAVLGAHLAEAPRTPALRLDGYRAALGDAGIPYLDELVVEAGLWHRSTGAEAMRALLDSGVSFDGVFCFNDTLALGALHTLLRAGLRVPDDVAVVGFDNIEDAEFSMPPLTSVEPGREQIAATAVELLAEQIDSKDAQREHRQVVADFAIKVRDSTVGTQAATT
jgi:DNA-binding LacI/PurR family transcriptional regulator